MKNTQSHRHIKVEYGSVMGQSPSEQAPVWWPTGYYGSILRSWALGQHPPPPPPMIYPDKKYLMHGCANGLNSRHAHAVALVCRERQQRRDELFGGWLQAEAQRGVESTNAPACLHIDLVEGVIHHEPQHGNNLR
eukprot:366029-Chlamydomonas_euryale.AAC.15